MRMRVAMLAAMLVCTPAQAADLTGFANVIDGNTLAVGGTKIRLERYIEARLPGADNAEMRKLVRAAIELAEAVKHGRAPDRTKAGVAADSVILLANMLRRLEE